MVATLSRASGNSYSIGNERRFDVWGQLRNGSGGPSQKYCANLGHSEDYVSGLTYMRARYYEPKTGRFISEDPSRDGWNWYGYCSGDPVHLVDKSGCAGLEDWIFAGAEQVFNFLLTATVLKFLTEFGGEGFLQYSKSGRFDNPLRMLVKGILKAVKAVTDAAILKAAKEGLALMKNDSKTWASGIAVGIEICFVLILLWVIDAGINEMIDMWAPKI